MPSTFSWIDLTQTLSSHSPCWDGCCGFESHVLSDYQSSTDITTFRVQEIKLFAGAGTHIDAPSHCFPGSKDVDELPLTELFAPASVIDVSRKGNEPFTITPSDILNDESKHGSITPGSIVLLHTGWHRYWNEPDRYRNQGSFPHLSQEAAELLLSREVLGLAIDTLSPDEASSDFPVHRLFLGKGLFIIENMCQADQLPARGAFVLAAPLKAKGLTEAPTRLLGLLPNQL